MSQPRRGTDRPVAVVDDLLYDPIPPRANIAPIAAALPTQPLTPPRQPQPRHSLPTQPSRQRGSLISALLVAILLFTLGQTAGETAAYLTRTQNVGANAFAAATAFAPSSVGAEAASTTITVSWAAVGFTVNGYNVYRSTVSGGPYTKVNGSLVVGTSYPDSGLAAGTYYYVVRLVNARGVESATNSAEVSAVADATLPTSAITAPTNGGYMTSTPFSITGTASDDRSGVALVEVSTDGGSTWNSATGTTSWSYSWAVSSAGSYTIQSRARDSAGNVQSPVTSVTATYDTSGPYVVPPTWPNDGSTGYYINRSVSVWFSEPMDQSSVQTAFSLKRCTTSACTAFASTWTAPTNGTISWHGENGNVLRFDPSANMATFTWYQISVSTTAKDLAGRSLTSAFTSTFQTLDQTDVVVPGITVTAPSTTTWTSASTYTLTGATDGMLVKAYRDNAPTGSFGGEDTLVTSGYTYGGATDFSLSVPLSAGVANRFIVTSTDTANNVSTPAFASIIYQAEPRTHVISWGFGVGNSNLNVFSPYLGDANGNNAAKIRWRTPAIGGTYGAQVSMTRYADYFGYTIPNLSPGTTYRVEVEVTDADGLASGTSINTQDVTTTGGSTSGLITSVIMDHVRLASRAPQSEVLTANVTGSAKYVQFTVNTSGADKVSACLTPSGGVATYTWDGTNGFGAAEPDSYYNWYATAYPTSATSCTGAAETMSGYLYITNANSIAMSPSPASVTIGAGQSACVTATARNRQGNLVEDGAAITFSYASAPAGGSYTLTQPSTGKIGGAASGCTAPAAGSGQAVAKVTVNSAFPSTITVTATMNTQLSGTTGTTVSGSTSLNDPPDAPDSLEVTPVNVAATSKLPGILASLLPSPAPTPGLSARFRAPRRGNAAGYTLLVGTTPGVYTRKINLGLTTTASVADGLVAGQRYYVAVQAYNKVGVVSVPSAETSLVVPTDTEVASLEFQGAGTATPSIVVGQPLPLRVTARNRAGQPVKGARVTLSGSPALRFDPASGTTETDGTLTTRLILDAPGAGRPVTVRASSETAAATIDLPTASPAGTLTTTPTGTPTGTLTVTPTGTLTATPPATVTVAPTGTLTPMPSATSTVAATASAVPTASTTPTRSVTATALPTGTVRPSATPLPAGTSVPTAAPTSPPTNTPRPAASATAPPTSTLRPTNTPTLRATSTPTPVPISTRQAPPPTPAGPAATTTTATTPAGASVTR